MHFKLQKVCVTSWRVWSDVIKKNIDQRSVDFSTQEAAIFPDAKFMDSYAIYRRCFAFISDWFRINVLE